MAVPAVCMILPAGGARCQACVLLAGGAPAAVCLNLPLKGREEEAVHDLCTYVQTSACVVFWEGATWLDRRSLQRMRYCAVASGHAGSGYIKVKCSWLS